MRQGGSPISIATGLYIGCETFSKNRRALELRIRGVLKGIGSLFVELFKEAASESSRKRGGSIFEDNSTTGRQSGANFSKIRKRESRGAMRAKDGLLGCWGRRVIQL